MLIGTLSGTLGRDAEVVTGDKPRMTFSVAGNFGYGENRKTVWFNCTKWGKPADNLVAALKSGTKVVVAGRMDPYENKDGKQSFSFNVSDLEIVSGGQTSGRAAPSRPAAKATEDVPFDDEIPF